MEEIQRVTGTLRATAGLIVGGTATQNPTAGYVFEVVGSTRLGTTTFATGTAVELAVADQLLRFTGGTSDYVGFKASTGITTTTSYTWPMIYPTSTGYVLQSTIGGELTWLDLGAAGLGDILAVGDCPDGECFTSGGTSGASLWFYDSDGRGQLTIADLTTARTYTLPDLTGTITLASGNLGTGGVLFADSDLIATSTNFYWDNASRYLQLGSANNAGQLRIYSSHASGYYLGFAATSTMTVSTTYYWPTNYGTDNYILTTDGAGQLQWTSATGTGAVTGTGADGQVAYWIGENSIDGDANFTWSTSTNKLTLGSGLVVPLIEYAGDLTLQTSGAGNDIILAPASGIVKLSGAGTYIETASGYKIGATGTQILREMIPIMGFDLPVQTATTSYVKISKTLENYPFLENASGTTRVHKLVFRYAASTTDPIEWRVSTSTGQTYSSSTLPAPVSNNLEQGDAYIATTSIPTDGTDWWLDIKTATVPDVVRAFQIFLAAYDEIN